MNAIPPPPQEAGRDWLVVRMERALLHAGGTHTIPDVLDQLRAGQAQCWQHGEGIAITELRQHPRLREVNVWLVAGDLADCRALEPRIVEFARQMGARRIVGQGRDGWERVACRHMGFHKAGVVLERWLDGA